MTLSQSTSQNLADAATDLGFTIVEFLVGLILFSFLSIMLLDSVKQLSIAWHGHARTTDRVTDLLEAESILRRTVEFAQPRLSRPAQAQASMIDFDGTRTTLRFLAPTPRAQRSNGLSWISVRSVAVRGVISLQIASIELAASTIDGKPGETDFQSLGTFQGAAFSYFGPSRDQASRGWTDEWVGRPRLPELVKVTLSTGRGERHFFIRPRLDREPVCSFDVMTRECRGQ